MAEGVDGSGDVVKVGEAGRAAPALPTAAPGDQPAPRRLLALTVLLTSLFWLAGGGLALFLWRQPEPSAFQIAPPPATPTPMPTATALPTPTPAPVWVDVGGAVQAPGVYQLPPGSRVQDALAAAGGVTTAADPRTLNLARLLDDGEKLYVPAAGEAAPAAAAEGLSRAVTVVSDQPAARLDINTATPQELDTLPGIGPKTAQAIVDYRQANGPFRSVEDLLQVKGIGEATLAKLRDLVTVAPP